MLSHAQTAQSFRDKTIASLNDGTFIRLTLSGPNAAQQPEKILGRAVEIRGVLHLSLVFRHPTRDITENLPMPAVARWLDEQLPDQFRNALLSTTNRDWQLSSKPGGTTRLISHKPARQSIPPREHDQKHVSLLDARANDWLIGLGILERDGKLKTSMADKLRQINHYLEIFSHLARDCGWLEAGPLTTPLHIVDMGCGKGYLTFGLWHLLNRIHLKNAHVTGIEARPDIVATTNALAQTVRADGLDFREGQIAQTQLESFDALIALHACDTATDDAIRRGIESRAKLIVVAPCCQKELRPQLGAPEPFAEILRHGIMAERMAEWSTDGLRAMFLEWAGYRTKVQEFVGSEHTPKNLMISAIRQSEPFTNPLMREKINALKQFLGVRQHTLDPLLDLKP